MNLMLPSARRQEGGKQPCIKVWKFDIRIPFVHYEWEIPEMIQACVVFLTGTAATQYLQDLFGFTFEMALSIVFVHELLYMVNNTMGDPLIGGWITPAVPLITTFLLNFEGTDRMYALVGMELILGLMYVILGITGIATKIIDICPQSLKGGILIGSGFAACCGTYGFTSVADGGRGFFAYPISWSIGVALGLFLLFANGFGKVKFHSKNKVIGVINKAGFVPAVIVAGVIGMVIGELDIPDMAGITSFWFNPLPGLQWVWQNFSIMGIGLPPADILIRALPMAIICYVIAFGDIVGGTAFLEDTKRFRRDEEIDINPDRTNICCGIRNLIEAFFSPTCTMSGPLWSAMTVSVAERYKTGKDNMYSIFGRRLHLQHHQVDLPADCAPGHVGGAHPAHRHGHDPDDPGLRLLLRGHQHVPHQHRAGRGWHHRRRHRHLLQPGLRAVHRRCPGHHHGIHRHVQEGTPCQRGRGHRNLCDQLPR